MDVPEPDCKRQDVQSEQKKRNSDNQNRNKEVRRGRNTLIHRQRGDADVLGSSCFRGTGHQKDDQGRERGTKKTKSQG